MDTSKGNLKIALPTLDKGGLDDKISTVFGKAKTLTVIDIEENQPKTVRVLENPAVSYKQGAGPIVVKMLVDLGVTTVLASEFGPGVSFLLDQNRVTKITVPAGSKVKESVDRALITLQK